MRIMKCGNCVYFGKVTRFCHCHSNKRVKKRTRHENSPKCQSWKPENKGTESEEDEEP